MTPHHSPTPVTPEAIGAPPVGLVESILGDAFGSEIALYAPVERALLCGSLTSGDNPLAPATYDAGAKTITAGMNHDLSGSGLPVGTHVLWAFQTGDLPCSGPYVVTDAGADDPGGHPAVFTRRADFDDDGDISRGAIIPVAQRTGRQGTLYMLGGGGPYTLDVTDLPFARKQLAPRATVLTMVGSGPLSDVCVCLADATGGAMDVTLPPARGATGPAHIKKTDASVNTVTILPDDPGETIDGDTSLVLTTQYQSVTLQSDGSIWHVTSAVG